MANAALMSAIRTRLHRAADPDRAAGAQAYLKSEMPSLGVRVPDVRRIVRAASRELPPASLPELRSTVLALWREAGWREERYAAIDLTGLRLAAGEWSMLPVYEEIIRSGAWWDLVDGVSHRLCELLQTHREDMSIVLRRWSTDPDLWIRRAAITAQLGAKSETDPALLEAVVEPNLADPEFFIRKAIGWALRDFGGTDPEWVRDFVARHGGALSPLSRREALRKIT
ncbi:DNA alkylation repair protein [Arthrobacter sp. U41]|uniref:DNA alkylation repair protein n=1 Tax=Arthrobacter sp. U41 TaxID=1849032 RepID=UPI0011A2AE1D|nr:DNA alkylation repair protein [Arthrobacter sp. U41]